MNGRSESGADPAQALLDLARGALEDGKANDVIAIDLRGKSPLSDHMLIASGTSSRHVSMLAERVTDAVKHGGGTVPRIEGADQGDWVLIDAGDIVVHLFRPEVREFYDLEGMWQGGANRATGLDS